MSMSISKNKSDKLNCRSFICAVYEYCTDSGFSCVTASNDTNAITFFYKTGEPPLVFMLSLLWYNVNKNIITF